MPATILGMRLHHTKNKGDLGVLYAQLDLAKRGWIICLPQTEHAEFDLVAYKDGRFLRVQVKYRTLSAEGTVVVQMATTWADRRGNHVQRIDRTAIDVICIYCPDTNRCYYVSTARVTGEHIRLRINPARNAQVKGIHHAEHFTEIPEDCGVSAPSATPLVPGPAIRHSREPRSPWGLARAHSSFG